MKRLLAGILGVVALSLAIFAKPAPSSAQLATFDASNFVKNTQTAAEEVKHTLQQAQQIETQSEILLQAMNQTALQTKMLSPLSVQSWSNAVANLQKMLSLISTDHQISIADSSLDTEFKQIFPDYIPAANYHALYSTWDVNTKRAALDVMNEAQFSVNDIPTETALIAKNRDNIAKATGQQQVLQATATLAEQQVEQLQKLQALDAYRTNMEAIYYQKTAAKETQDEQNTQAWQAWKKTANPSATSMPSL